MIRTSAWTYLLWIGLVLPAASGEPQTYRGLCEASTAVFLDDTHFAVASDETNIIRIYTRGDTSVGTESDFQIATGFDKSDIEASARVGDRIYWLSSHSLNSQGEDKKKRKVFFASRIVPGNGSVTLEPTGIIVSLRDPLLAAAGVTKADLNIEGLAATPEGELLIGLRDTVAGKALVVPFHNPAEVIDHNKPPEFGTPQPLDLEGNGIRSLERFGTEYLIVAGPVSDQGGFALYSWSGLNKDDAVPVPGISFSTLRPEAMMVVPGTSRVQILSDDGSDDCSDEGPVEQRAFRSIDVTP